MLKLAVMAPLPVAATAGAGMLMRDIIRMETSAIRMAVLSGEDVVDRGE